jgi:hypothetical protein
MHTILRFVILPFVQYCLAFVSIHPKSPVLEDGYPGKECDRVSTHENGGNGHRF